MPIPTLDYKKIERNIKAFFVKYCSKRRKGETDAKLSVRCSFQTAVKRAISYKGKNAIAKKTRGAIEAILVCFIESEDYSTLKILDLMDKIRTEYQDAGIIDWTYGNSQKWINIAIKYYLVLKCHTLFGTAITSKVRDMLYTLMPVDRQMIEEHVNPDMGIDFYALSGKVSWSDCDSRQVFINYWEQIRSKLYAANKDWFPILYEIQSW